MDWNLLEESHGLCVMLEHCEHGFQQASLDGEQLQHLVQEDNYFRKMIKLFFFTENLHHELPKPFPSAALLQLDLVAVKNVVIKVHIVPGDRHEVCKTIYTTEILGPKEERVKCDYF